MHIISYNYNISTIINHLPRALSIFAIGLVLGRGQFFIRTNLTSVAHQLLEKLTRNATMDTVAISS